MRTLKQARKEKRFNQQVLAALVGIHRESLSLLERGLSKPTPSTKEKFERVLGKIDWIETNSKVQLKSPDYREAERLINQLVSITATMEGEDKKAIKKLITKYFK